MHNALAGSEAPPKLLELNVSFEVEGFLSESLAGRFSSIPQCSEWFHLAKELNRIGKKFAFEEKVFEIEGSGLSD